MITSLLCLFLAAGCGPDAKQSIAPDLVLSAGVHEITVENIDVRVWVLNRGAVVSTTTTMTMRVNNEPNWDINLWAAEAMVPPIAPGDALLHGFDVRPDAFDAGDDYYVQVRVDPIPQEHPWRRYNQFWLGFTLDEAGEVVVRCKTPATEEEDPATDPLHAEQWPLNNVGQSGYAYHPGTPGEDLGMSATMSAGRPTGRGVRIGILDTGMEVCHPDLAANVAEGASFNANMDSWHGVDAVDPFEPSTLGDHGTSVAGVVAAVAGNGIGGRGVAPDATLHGFNILSATEFDQAYIDATGASDADPPSASIDVFNMSFGSFPGVRNIEDSERVLFENGVQNLRNGLGAVYVKAAGNAFRACSSMRRPANGRIGCAGANGDASQNIPFLVVVGAFNAHGVKASYSSAGSNLWVTAPAGEFGSAFPASITTDQMGWERGYDVLIPIGVVHDSVDNPDGDYVSTFNGTSAAAPHASGAVALLLEAYPEFTWRDVKHVLAKTARQIDPHARSVRYVVGGSVYTAQHPWITNAAGYRFHNWYGFGAVHVDDALAFAATHTPDGLGEFTETDAFIREEAVSIPDADGSGVAQTLTVEGLAGTNIEAVTLHVDITHPMTNDLGIHLISPAGTESIVNPIYNDAHAGNADLDWNLLSNAFYGESPNGDWTIKVVDAAAADEGTLDGWSLTFALGTHP